MAVLKTEKGKYYWLKLCDSNPALYVGTTKKKGVMWVMKPSCCLQYAGGKDLDKLIKDTNEKNLSEYTAKIIALTDDPTDATFTLNLFEAVEVVYSHVKNCKRVYKLKQKTS